MSGLAQSLAMYCCHPSIFFYLLNFDFFWVSYSTSSVMKVHNKGTLSIMYTLANHCVMFVTAMLISSYQCTPLECQYQN